MDQSNHPDDYKNICIFLFKGLMYIHNNKKNAIPEGGTENLTKKNCQYLIYRLNHELRNIKEHPCNTSIFIQKVNSYISNLSSEYNICENEIKELGSIVFNNIEVLNVLYKHLNNYIYGSFKKHEERCNCAKKCAELYDNLLPHCYLYKSTFCNALIKFGNRYNQYLAGEDKCPELKKCLYFPQTENRNSEVQLIGKCNIPVKVKTIIQAESLLPAMYDTSAPLGYKLFTGFSLLLLALPVLFNFYKVNKNFD